MSYERMLGMGENGTTATTLTRLEPEYSPPSITPEEALRREEREAILEEQRNFNQWLDDIFPRSIYSLPPKMYVASVANTLGIPGASGTSRLVSAGFAAMPLLAGYLVYKKTDGSIPWTAVASVGSLYGLPVLLFFLALSSGGFRY
jgi:hypothetical protein